MAQDVKHSYNSHRKQSIGYKQGNMAAFMYRLIRQSFISLPVKCWQRAER